MALETVLHSVRLPHRIDKPPCGRQAKISCFLRVSGRIGISDRKLDVVEETSSRVSVKLRDSDLAMDTAQIFSRLVPVPLLAGDCSEPLIRVSHIDFTVEPQFDPLMLSFCFFRSSSDDAKDDTSSLNVLSASSSSSAAVQSIPPPRQSQEDPERQDFHVNIGYAIRTLREEMPCLFYKDLSYDIYRKDIVFRDPLYTVGGIDYYKLIFRALRVYGRVFFKALWVDILRIWQPSDNVIMVRWQVRGIPRVPWEAQGVFDGTSEYKLDKQGKIYEHKVDNVALNARPKMKVPTVEELLRVGTCSSTPKPTFFQQTLGAISLVRPYLFQFTWVRYYLALKGTLGLHQNPDMQL